MVWRRVRTEVACGLPHGPRREGTGISAEREHGVFSKRGRIVHVRIGPRAFPLISPSRSLQLALLPSLIPSLLPYYPGCGGSPVSASFDSGHIKHERRSAMGTCGADRSSESALSGLTAHHQRCRWSAMAKCAPWLVRLCPGLALPGFLHPPSAHGRALGGCGHYE